MQHHISPEWLDELTAEEQDTLREMWEPREGDWFRHIDYREHMEYFKNDEYEGKPAFLYYESHDPFIAETPDKKEGDLPLLCIGQMTELLGKNLIYIKNGSSYWIVRIRKHGDELVYQEKELARALWEAVKEVIKAEATRKENE